MKRLFSIIGGGLGVLVITGLAVVLISSLSGVGQPPIDAPETTQTAIPSTPVQSEVAPVAAATATLDPGVFRSPLREPTEPPLPPPSPSDHPPLCNFEGGITEKPETPSQLEQFVFSEPKVIFSREAPIEIIEWLPNNQGLLIHISTPTKQSIEVLDTATGQTEVYADNLQDARQIHWVADENAVVYTDRKTSEFSGIDQYGVWLSRGGGQSPQLLLEDANKLQTTATAKQLSPTVTQAFNIYDFSFDSEQWRYNKYPEDSRILQSWAGREFSSSVSPDGSKAILFGGPWLYLIDLKTGQPCEVDLSKYMQTYYIEQGPLWVFDAQWSPDGKLLAMRTTVGYREELMRSNKLVILNTVTGELYRPEIKWSHIWDEEWFPDNRHLVAMGQRGDIENAYQNQQLGMVDTFSESFHIILHDHIFGGGQPDFQLALSPNGQSLSIKCPIWSKEKPLILKNQICFVSVQTKN